MKVINLSREQGSGCKNSKNPYIRTLNFQGQAAIGSYLMSTNSNIRLLVFLNRFFIYGPENVHNNLQFYSSVSKFNTVIVLLVQEKSLEIFMIV